MKVSYTGYLFQIQRASDSTTLNVGSLSYAPYQADLSGVASFCQGTTCKYSEVYDQIGSYNLPQTNSAYQSLYTVTTIANGTTVPIIATNGQSGAPQYYRNRTATGLATGGSTDTTVYMAINTNVYSTCCGQYGNMEATVSDTGNGHMFAAAFATGTAGVVGTGTGPWCGADWENGVYLYGPTITAPLAACLIKYNHTTPSWAAKSSDPTAGTFTTQYSGALPSGYTAAFEGGTSIGEGGDGTPAPINFFEGAQTVTATSDATDNALQANMVAFYGQTSSSFNPGQLYPSVWFSADQGVVTSGSNVTSWASQTNAVTCSGSGGSYPTYTASALNGKPALTMNGSQGCTFNVTAISALPHGNNQGYFLVVGKPTAATGFETAFIYGNNSGNYRLLGLFSGSNAPFASCATSSCDTVATGYTWLNTPGITEWSFNSATATDIYFNGNITSYTGQSFGNAPPSTTGQIGLNPAGQNWTGDIEEIVILPYTPTTAQIQKMEGYEACKYGLQSSLPSGHPYKTICP